MPVAWTLACFHRRDNGAISDARAGGMSARSLAIGKLAVPASAPTPCPATAEAQDRQERSAHQGMPTAPLTADSHWSRRQTTPTDNAEPGKNARHAPTKRSHDRLALFH